MAALLETIEIPVQGMTCGHCVSTVKKALENVPGVESAEVVLQPGLARVIFDAGATETNALKSAITMSGYQVPTDSKIEPPVVAPLITIGSLNPTKTPMPTPLEDWNLAVGGMHCASCVLRVEDALRAVAGVQSVRVNLATERASLSVDPRRVAESSLAAAAESAGYSARRAELTVGDGADSLRSERAAGVAYWRTRLIEGVLLTVPLVMMDFIGARLFTPAGWVMFPLATILMIELGSPYFIGAWKRLKQGASNMDTLIALGTSTAYGYSLYFLLRDHGFRLAYLPAVAISAAYGILVVGLSKLWTRKQGRMAIR